MISYVAFTASTHESFSPFIIPFGHATINMFYLSLTSCYLEALLYRHSMYFTKEGDDLTYYDNGTLSYHTSKS